MTKGKHSDDAFDILQGTVSTMADTNKTNWNLVIAWITGTLLVARSLWRTKYDAWKPVATRTPQMTFEKNEARAHYEPLLNQLIGELQHNPLVTDSDRKAMGIYHEPHSNTPLPPTNETVDFAVETDVDRRIIIHFFVTGSTSKAKPHGVQAVEIRWGILDEDTTEVEDLPHVDLDTRSPFTLDFDQSERGKKVYFAGRWVMKNGGAGRWSEVTYAIVP
jgi:hypothetical protein